MFGRVGKRTDAREFPVACVGSHLWGFTGSGVWTDSVQGAVENNFRRFLSNADVAQSRRRRGEICARCPIDAHVRRGERYFLSPIFIFRVIRLARAERRSISFGLLCPRSFGSSWYFGL